jgi:hypothetical protein
MVRLILAVAFVLQIAQIAGAGAAEAILVPAWGALLSQISEGPPEDMRTLGTSCKGLAPLGRAGGDGFLSGNALESSLFICDSRHRRCNPLKVT